MSADFIYRDGHIDDIEAVFRLNRQVFDEAWSKDVMLQSLQVGYDLYVCLAGDALIGYVLSQDILLETQIMQVCVHQDYRRLGVAKKLMLQLMQNKRDMQALMLEVRSSNQVAQSFYTNLGFARAGIRPNYYSKTKSKPREDAVIMAWNAQ
jgi:ribosomal-protein-alanine N-acetyltransferase